MYFELLQFHPPWPLHSHRLNQFFSKKKISKTDHYRHQRPLSIQDNYILASMACYIYACAFMCWSLVQHAGGTRHTLSSLRIGLSLVITPPGFQPFIFVGLLCVPSAKDNSDFFSLSPDLTMCLSDWACCMTLLVLTGCMLAHMMNASNYESAFVKYERKVGQCLQILDKCIPAGAVVLTKSSSYQQYQQQVTVEHVMVCRGMWKSFTAVGISGSREVNNSTLSLKHHLHIHVRHCVIVCTCTSALYGWHPGGLDAILFRRECDHHAVPLRRNDNLCKWQNCL